MTSARTLAALTAMMNAKRRLRKVVDEEHTIRCVAGLGLLREEVWVDEHDRVHRYNLAFINHALSAADNGRVLGYDNQHGKHHRHWFGETSDVRFMSYEALLERFITEVAALQERALEDSNQN